MFAWLTSIFRSPTRDGRRLCKDIHVILETDRQTSTAKHMERVAEFAREEIKRVDSRLARRPKDKPVIRYDVQQEHKKARTSHQNALYTAMTLVLIRMKAQDLGEHGVPALKQIDDFLNDPLADPYAETYNEANSEINNSDDESRGGSDDTDGKPPRNSLSA